MQYLLGACFLGSLEGRPSTVLAIKALEKALELDPEARRGQASLGGGEGRSRRVRRRRRTCAGASASSCAAASSAGTEAGGEKRPKKKAAPKITEEGAG